MIGCNCSICVSRRLQGLPEIPYSNDPKEQQKYLDTLKKRQTVEGEQ